MIQREQVQGRTDVGGEAARIGVGGVEFRDLGEEGVLLGVVRAGGLPAGWFGLVCLMVLVWVCGFVWVELVVRGVGVGVMGAGALGLLVVVVIDPSLPPFPTPIHPTQSTLDLSTSPVEEVGLSRLQQQRGIEDSPDEHFDDVMRISHGTANPVLVRKAVDLAAATIDWLMDNGFEMAPECPALHFYHEPYRTPRTYWGVDGGASVLAVLERVRAAAWGEANNQLNGPRWFPSPRWRGAAQSGQARRASDDVSAR